MNNKHLTALSSNLFIWIWGPHNVECRYLQNARSTLIYLKIS